MGLKVDEKQVIFEIDGFKGWIFPPEISRFWPAWGKRVK
jgi:hypothetical protein